MAEAALCRRDPGRECHGRRAGKRCRRADPRRQQRSEMVRGQLRHQDPDGGRGANLAGQGPRLSQGRGSAGPAGFQINRAAAAGVRARADERRHPEYRPRAAGQSSESILRLEGRWFREKGACRRRDARPTAIDPHDHDLRRGDRQPRRAFRWRARSLRQTGGGGGIGAALHARARSCHLVPPWRAEGVRQAGRRQAHQADHLVRRVGPAERAVSRGLCALLRRSRMAEDQLA